MKRIMFSLVLLLIVSGLFAKGFEFLGIRSGMTKEEVKIVIEYDKLSEEGDYRSPKIWFDEDFYIFFKDDNYIDKTYTNKFTKYPAHKIHFTFTDDDILMKIEIDYFRVELTEKSYLIDSEAQLRALTSNFPNAEIYNDVRSNFISVVLEDDAVFNQAVTKKMNEFLIQYKD